MIQLIMKISEIKVQRFEAILTPLSSKITVVVSNLDTKKGDRVYVYIRLYMGCI